MDTTPLRIITIFRGLKISHTEEFTNQEIKKFQWNMQKKKTNFRLLFGMSSFTVTGNTHHLQLYTA